MFMLTYPSRSDMPRAKIPYEDLQARLESMFPWPTYRTVRLLKPKRDNRIKAPTTVYDREGGNFKRIGYRCQVILERYEGQSEDLSRTLWDTTRMNVIVQY